VATRWQLVGNWQLDTQTILRARFVGQSVVWQLDTLPSRLALNAVGNSFGNLASRQTRTLTRP